MAKIKEIFEDFHTWKGAKKHGRTFYQQKYRNNLAKNLRELRKWDFWKDNPAETLLDNVKWNPEYLDSLWEWRKVGKELAEKLIEKWLWWVVAENPGKFEWLVLDKEIAEKLIEKWFYRTVVVNLGKFKWLDKEIAEKLIRAWYEYVVSEHPEKFWLKKGK